MTECGGLLDGILAVAHPELYQKSLSLCRTITDTHPQSSEIMALWPFCFNAAQIIVNWQTIMHRDTGSRAEWYDLLLTMGSYGIEIWYLAMLW